MNTFQKILYHPVVIGMIFGSISGSGAGLIVANEYDRASKKDLIAGACIGCLVGSCHGAIVGLITKFENNRK